MNQTATPKVDVRVRPNVISVKSRKTTAYSDKIVNIIHKMVTKMVKAMIKSILPLQSYRSMKKNTNLQR